jgi:hypothetical protein
MSDQTTDFNKDEPSTWKDKKEAMQRLARALENTSPPLMKKNTNSPPPIRAPLKCKCLTKLKNYFEKLLTNNN